MWVQMPKGYESVSLERQEFNVEFTDEGGENFMRVPDHFGPVLMNMGLGFRMLDKPPTGAPADLPKADPLRDAAISTLTAENQALRDSIREAREDVIAANARVQALTNENAALRQTMAEKDQRIADLEAALEDADKPIPEVAGKKK